VVRRQPDGAVQVLSESPNRIDAQPTEEPVGTVPGESR
jgi:hypothetical protein